MPELIYRTATDLAGIIRDKKVSAAEILDAHLDQISKYNPRLNAIVTLNEEAARQRAHEADAALANGESWGPLHGVPVTIKDAFETAGLRTTSSFKPLKNYIPERDATVVVRLRQAGAIILGKTNMPMLALDIQSDSPIFGRANNPWDITCTPGGSTGGGAASLAAGMSPLEIGSDFGG
ncbi:MAG: amidase, partial [Deltaproteobacteria bacterium]|nr:amidase [Deltaproteobacteria bacterium]